MACPQLCEAAHPYHISGHLSGVAPLVDTTADLSQYWKRPVALYYGDQCTSTTPVNLISNEELYRALDWPYRSWCKYHSTKKLSKRNSFAPTIR